MIKRRRQLQSHTPLVRKAQLRRARRVGGSGPTKPRRRGQSPEEKRCRELLEVRSGGYCEIQVSRLCQRRASVCSHRKRRSQSSRAEKWSLTNVLHGCGYCEMYLTDHGSDPHVRRRGWTVHPSADPARVPVLRNGVRVWLREDGRFDELGEQEIREWMEAA